MKKAFLVLTVFFVALFFVAACSKDDKNKNKKMSTLTIEADGVAVERLDLFPSQTVNLRAIVRDKDGIIQVNVPVNWASTPGLGSFSPSNTNVSQVHFMVANAQSIPEGELFIKAEYNDFFKQIPVAVDSDTLTVIFTFEGLNQGQMKAGTTIRIKATVKRSNGVEDTGAIVSWATDNNAGVFDSQSSAGHGRTYSDEFINYLVPGGLIGTVTFFAAIRNQHFESDPITLVSED